jgi:hypothetical protein
VGRALTYFRQLRGERDATLAHVRAEIRSHYLLVGLADRMLESIYMLARLAGWPTDGLLEHFVSANVNTHHKVRPHCSPCGGRRIV